MGRVWTLGPGADLAKGQVSSWTCLVRNGKKITEQPPAQLPEETQGAGRPGNFRTTSAERIFLNNRS